MSFCAPKIYTRIAFLARKDLTLFKNLIVAGAVSLGATVLPSESKASEWGCQVLLCLSGDWQGTPSCHPPINRLIAAMKVPGFDWPTCPQANSTAARRDPYKECPAGFHAIGDESRRGGRDGDYQPPMCIRRVSNNGWRNGVKNNSLADKSGSAAVPVNITNGKLTLPDGSTVTVNRSHESSNSGMSSTTIYSFPRPLREKPWYIEYNDANGKRQRSWFNLNL